MLSSQLSPRFPYVGRTSRRDHHLIPKASSFQWDIIQSLRRYSEAHLFSPLTSHFSETFVSHWDISSSSYFFGKTPWPLARHYTDIHPSQWDSRYWWDFMLKEKLLKNWEHFSRTLASREYLTPMRPPLAKTSIFREDLMPKEIPFGETLHGCCDLLPKENHSPRRQLVSYCQQDIPSREINKDSWQPESPGNLCIQTNRMHC